MTRRGGSIPGRRPRSNSRPAGGIRDHRLLADTGQRGLGGARRLRSAWQDATEVTLTAVPKVGSRFAKFERVNCGPFACRVSPCQASVNPCSITMRLDPTWSVDLRIWFDKTDLTRPDIFAYATTGDGEPYAAGSWTSQPVTVSYLCVDQHTDASGLETLGRRRDDRHRGRRPVGDQ